MKQAVGTGREVVSYTAVGRCGRMWLARGLTKAAGAGREAGDFTATDDVATRADASDGRVL